MNPEELATQKIITRFEGKISRIEASTEKMEKAIFGNGRPGLVERVATLETKVALVSAVAGLIGSGIIELIKHLF